MTLLYGCNEGLCKWASMGLYGRDDGFDADSKAIGVVDGEKILAAVVYNNFLQRSDRSMLSLEMSIYSVDKRWATRQNLKAFFCYPFTDLGVGRVQTICSASDGGVILFNKKLGFVQEGYHREAWPDGGDALSFSMLRGECKWA